MATKNAALIFGFCFALAACADSATNRSITAPAGSPAFDLSSSSVELSGFDMLTGEPFTRAADIGVAQAATGGRASGHADIGAEIDFHETYSFVALSTGTFPDAKGQFNGRLRSTFGEFELQLDITCLQIIGNRASLSGTVKKFVSNGIVVDVPEGWEAAVTVQDNGEGADAPPDQASFINGFFTTPQVCQFFIDLGNQPSQDGNIQVSQK